MIDGRAAPGRLRWFLGSGKEEMWLLEKEWAIRCAAL